MAAPTIPNVEDFLASDTTEGEFRDSLAEMITAASRFLGSGWTVDNVIDADGDAPFASVIMGVDTNASTPLADDLDTVSPPTGGLPHGALLILFAIEHSGAVVTVKDGTAGNEGEFLLTGSADEDLTTGTECLFFIWNGDNWVQMTSFTAAAVLA